MPHPVFDHIHLFGHSMTRAI